MSSSDTVHIRLEGIFDRPTAEELALTVDEILRQDRPPPVIDAGQVSDVLAEAVLVLRAREVLRECVWENVPPALTQYAQLMGVRLTTESLDEGHAAPKSAEDPQGPLGEAFGLACAACGETMKVSRPRPGNYACPHCHARFHLDRYGQAVYYEARAGSVR